jgi:hypothetical protein
MRLRRRITFCVFLVLHTAPVILLALSSVCDTVLSRPSCTVGAEPGMHALWHIAQGYKVPYLSVGQPQPANSEPMWTFRGQVRVCEP